MTEETDNGIFTKEKITIMSLPVFRAVYNLSSLLIKVTNNFPKAFKHTLGSRIIDASLDLSKILFSYLYIYKNRDYLKFYFHYSENNLLVKISKRIDKKICKKLTILADLYIYSLREATANRYIVPFKYYTEDEYTYEEISVIIDNLIIYVPAESVNAYKTAPGWSEYASRIQAISN